MPHSEKKVYIVFFAYISLWPLQVPHKAGIFYLWMLQGPLLCHWLRYDIRLSSAPTCSLAASWNRRYSSRHLPIPVSLSLKNVYLEPGWL